MTKSVYFILVLLTLGFLFIPAITAQTTEFTYQGSLRDGGQTPNANYDFEFRLYDAPSGGTQIGSVLIRTGVAVSEGVFAVKLDFPGGFPGADRYLEIGVRTAGGGGFTVLNPRQKFQSTPYAIRSLTAASSTNAEQLNGVAANQFVVTTDPRMTNSRTPTAGSGFYVQNSTSVQAGTVDFNISGTGSAGVLNSSAQFNLGGQRVLSAGGNGNLFAGRNSGTANTSGIDNSFFGFSTGPANTLGANNSFFGAYAGEANTTGRDNSFFGQRSGGTNLSGANNSFFGSFSGQFNATGSDNSFFGTYAGFSNTASFNSFFGSLAGLRTTTGLSNSFIGAFAGQENTVGSYNSFVGSLAGNKNTTGINNTYVGASSGAENFTGTDNSFFGVNTGNANRVNRNSFFGSNAGVVNNFGSENSFFGHASGRANTIGERNTFFGFESGKTNVSGSSNTIIGAGADVVGSSLMNATVIGADAVVSTSNTVVLGRPVDTVRIPGGLNVSGAISGTFSVPATSITGILGTANGGTGLSSAGAAGNFLRSNGSIWTSSPLFAADIPALGASYIQNSLSLQPASNFNISGNGTAGGTLTGNVVNSLTNFNIAGNRVLSVNGTDNIFVGKGTGITGSSNSFFGNNAGTNNVSGGSNTLIGSNANAASGNLFFATAVGADALVSTSNTVVLGRAQDTVRVPGSLNVTGTISGSFTVPAASITGVIAPANGGTGLSATGANGNFLRSNGSIWTSSPFGVSDIPSGSSSYIQNGTVQQAMSNFNISGSGTVGGNLNVAGTFTAGSFSVPVANITGVLDVTKGGTGLSASGANGNILRSNGSIWTSSAFSPSDIPAGSTSYIQNGVGQQSSSNFNISGNGTIGGNLSVGGSISGSFSVPAANITGVISAAQGGTGPAGASGNFLRSNGSTFTSSPITAADFPANSTNYIQNSIGIQSSSNFNISGNGTVGGTLSAGTVNSVGNYNIGGNRVLSIAGTANVFAGAGTGTAGSSNSFFGNGAGAANVTGSSNTIIGAEANVKTGALTNATAIGAKALAAQNNSVVLGSINGENGSTITASVGIGTNTPKARLDVTEGNILVGSPGQGIILKSPNGATCRLMAIDNSGAMTLTAITCP